MFENIFFIENTFYYYHSFSCEDCVLLDTTLEHIKSLIDHNIHLPGNQRVRYQTIFKRQYELIQEWKKHQLRTVHQEAAKDWILEQLDDTSASNILSEVFIQLFRKKEIDTIVANFTI